MMNEAISTVAQESAREAAQDPMSPGTKVAATAVIGFAVYGAGVLAYKTVSWGKQKWQSRKARKAQKAS